uniref:Zn(2)-C6 fungal-type domain-containing protein n=1 Tax=Bionectria ochroleuca TaxID=29856 RepID=A0A8H7NCB4_BIOOC
MPVVKIPCLQCKEKHVKCDDQQPKCGRCESKGLTCERPSKKTVFHHDSSANFSKDQKWVSSQAKLFQFDAHTPAPGPATASAAASSPASGSGVSGAGRPESRGADELSLRDRMSQDRSPLFTTSGSADLGSTCASASPSLLPPLLQRRPSVARSTSPRSF